MNLKLPKTKPLLLDALGSLAAPVLGGSFGKGLQVDRVPRGKGLKVDAQQRPYRRVKKNFRNKPNSNFDIMNWVKELKTKKMMVFSIRIAASGRLIAE